MITYQFADASHIPQMAAIWCEVFGDSPEYVQQFYQHWIGKGKFLIARNSEQVVGMVHLLPAQLFLNQQEHSAYYFYAGAVMPEFRSQGVYTRLIESVQRSSQREHADIILVPASAMLFRYYERFGFQAVPLYSSVTVQHSNSALRDSPLMKELTADRYSKLLDRDCQGLHCTLRWDEDALEYVIREIRACGGFAKQFEIQGVSCAALGYCETGMLQLIALAAPETCKEAAFQVLMQSFQRDVLMYRAPVRDGPAPHCGMILTPDGVCPKEIYFPHDLS